MSEHKMEHGEPAQDGNIHPSEQQLNELSLGSRQQIYELANLSREAIEDCKKAVGRQAAKAAKSPQLVELMTELSQHEHNLIDIQYASILPSTFVLPSWPMTEHWKPFKQVPGPVAKMIDRRRRIMTCFDEVLGILNEYRETNLSENAFDCDGQDSTILNCSKYQMVQVWFGMLRKKVSELSQGSADVKSFNDILITALEWCEAQVLDMTSTADAYQQIVEEVRHFSDAADEPLREILMGRFAQFEPTRDMAMKALFQSIPPGAREKFTKMLREHTKSDNEETIYSIQDEMSRMERP